MAEPLPSSGHLFTKSAPQQPPHRPRLAVLSSLRASADTVLLGGARAAGSAASLDRRVEAVFPTGESDGGAARELALPGCVSAALSPDGRLLLAVSAAGGAAVWSTEAAVRRCALDGPVGFLAADCGADSAAVAAGPGRGGSGAAASLFCGRVAGAASAPPPPQEGSDAADHKPQPCGLLLWSRRRRPEAFFASLAFPPPPAPPAAAPAGGATGAAPRQLLLGTTWAGGMHRLCAESGREEAPTTPNDDVGSAEAPRRRLSAGDVGAGEGDDAAPARSCAAAEEEADGLLSWGPPGEPPRRAAVAASSDLSAVLTAPAAHLVTTLLSVAPPAAAAGPPCAPAVRFSARGNRGCVRDTFAFLAGSRCAFPPGHDAHVGPFAPRASHQDFSAVRQVVRNLHARAAAAAAGSLSGLWTAAPRSQSGAQPPGSAWRPFPCAAGRVAASCPPSPCPRTGSGLQQPSPPWRAGTKSRKSRLRSRRRRLRQRLAEEAAAVAVGRLCPGCSSRPFPLSGAAAAAPGPRGRSPPAALRRAAPRQTTASRPA